MLKHLAFALSLLALGLFFPGILLPMFNMQMDLAAQVGPAQINSQLISQELSILGTIEELWHQERFLVASLILLFSVGVPLCKSLLMSLAYVKRNTSIEVRIHRFVASIGKWSMADVFVVAVFLAVLSTQHSETASEQQLNLFGFKLDLLISSQTLSGVGDGFYYFVGYCLVSLLASHLAMLKMRSEPRAII